MAEIGLAASVIAVIQLSEDVLTRAYKYGLSVKNAKNDMAEIGRDLKDMETIFKKLGDFAKKAQNAGIRLEDWPTLVSLNDPLSTCKKELGELLKEIEPVDGTIKAGLQRVKWPHKKEKVMKSLSRIKAQKVSFQEALQIEQMEQILKTGHVVENISAGQKEIKKSTVVSWLAHVDPSTNHNAARVKHDEHTSRWFIKGKAYNEWKTTPHSCLLLHGIPGAGKTILCSEIIASTEQYCVDHPGFSFAYFYFTFREDAKQKRDAFLRSILSQLVHQMKRLPKAVLHLYNRYQHEQPPAQALEDVLCNVIKRTKQGGEVFILVDALDECPEGPERDYLLASISKIYGWAIPNLHILLTSRKHPDIEDKLSSFAKSISITKEVESDIRLYVKNQLNTRRKLSRWPQNIQEDIETSLVNGANGMFQWVFCQLEALEKCVSPNAVQKALKCLPPTLDETYERILRNIAEEHRKYAAAAVHWLAFSARPLSLEELAEAAIIDPDTEEPIDLNDRIPPNMVIEILASMVVITARSKGNASDVVVFAHFSVQEYLMSNRVPPDLLKFRITETIAHCFIGQSCIKYLSTYALSKRKTLSINEGDSYDTYDGNDYHVFPLLAYACGSWRDDLGWSKHAKALNAHIHQVSFADKIIEFLMSGSIFLKWLYIFDEIEYINAKSSGSASPLYYASYLGLDGIVSILIGRGADVNFQQGEFNNALQMASYYGHEATGNALQAAAIRGGNNSMLKLLLENGAAVNMKGGYYGSALQAASDFGNNNAVKLLIEKGASVNMEGGKYGNALNAALSSGYNSNGHVRSCLLLINSGANLEGLDTERADELREFAQESEELKQALENRGFRL